MRPPASATRANAATVYDSSAMTGTVANATGEQHGAALPRRLQHPLRQGVRRQRHRGESRSRISRWERIRTPSRPDSAGRREPRSPGLSPWRAAAPRAPGRARRRLRSVVSETSTATATRTSSPATRAATSGSTLATVSNGFGTHVRLAGDWQSMTAIVAVGDMTGDGHPDIVARDPNGVLWLYPGNGSNGFGARIQLATGWQDMTAITGVGDFNGDGYNDIVARDSSGNLWLYPGTGSRWSRRARRQIPGSWSSMTSIVGRGRLQRRRHTPTCSMRDSSGILWLYPGNRRGHARHAHRGRRRMVQATPLSRRATSTTTATQDLIARDTTRPTLAVPGNGHRRFHEAASRSAAAGRL